ncbi:hypothetical protein FQ187_05955 [Pseudomonas sp. ANT_J28]|nr:hypothetical protein FQ187_05955 [Pseudomonas sp. ANT_J28]
MPSTLTFFFGFGRGRWALLSLAAFGPTMFLLVVYISISAVTADGGFALTARHFFQRQKSTQKGSPRASGPSPRLGVPSLRYPSGDTALRSAARRPTCSVFDCVERRCAPLPG